MSEHGYDGTTYDNGYLGFSGIPWSGVEVLNYH